MDHSQIGSALRVTFDWEISMAALVLALLLVLPTVALGQVKIPTPAQDQLFSYEAKDWGVSTTSRPQGPPFGKPTPTSIPGARVIRTLALKELLYENKQVIVIDVLNNKKWDTVPAAHWMPGAGDSRFYAAEISRFEAALEKLTGGDKSRPLVFMCLSSECWESYNACLHALAAGYKDVLWYRGGRKSWTGANLDGKKPEQIDW